MLKAKTSLNRVYYHQINAKRNLTTGLFGLQEVNEAKDWTKLSKKTILKCNKSVQILTNEPNLQPREIIQLMDSISESVCSVVDPADLCRSVHPSATFREEADRTWTEVSTYIHNLNANPNLHKVTSYAVDHSHHLTSEEKRIAQQLKDEFEVSGIHLPLEQRNRVVELQGEIAQLGDQFMQNLHDPEQYDKSAPIHHSKLSLLPSSLANDAQRQGDYIFLPTNTTTMNTILYRIRDSDVRKAVFFGGHTSVKDNNKVLSDLLATRHELARTLSFPSYSAFTLAHGRMAKSSEQVQQFLESISTKIQRKAESEIELLKEEKKKQEGSSNIYGWDQLYYTCAVKENKFKIVTNQLDEYFSVENCLKGLHIIVSSLFGLSIRAIPMEKNESWHPDVIKIEVTDPSEGVCGYVYLDLFDRDDKFGHWATFAIQFSKIDGSTGKLKQLPKVAMVCPISKSNTSVPLLSHNEVETLFHEFGHCLSLLLSRTEYQHLAGTRSALDFVEFPSTLMEFFAWDYRVLSQFARHYKTGEVLPKSLVENRKASKHLFSAIETQTQVCYGMFDQLIHGPNPLPASPTEIFEQVQNKYTPFAFVPGTHWHTRFGHLVSYGASYYSYLYCRTFSSSVWHKCFAKDPLNREAGEKYRKEVLQYGGTKDPSEMLKSLLGEEPTVESCSKWFLKEIE